MYLGCLACQEGQDVLFGPGLAGQAGHAAPGSVLPCGLWETSISCLCRHLTGWAGRGMD